MKTTFFTLFFISLSTFINAQQSFERHYTFNNWSSGETVLEIPGIGYYTIGWNDSLAFDSLGIPTFDYVQCLVTKIDYNGDTIKTFRMGNGDTTFLSLYGDNGDDLLRVGIVTQDENIMAAGATQSYGAESYYDYDLWLVKFNANLDTLWSKQFSIPDSALFIYFSDATTNDKGGMVIPAYQASIANGFRESCLTSFDSAGNLLFHQRLLPGVRSQLFGAAQTSDRGFLCTGLIDNAPDNYSPVIIKTDSLGREQWHQILPYWGAYHRAQDIVKT